MTSGIKAVAFDVDGTLITSSIWHAMYALFGLPPEENEKHHGKYVRGEINFREQMDGIAEFFKTLTPPSKEALVGVLKAFEFVSGAEETIRSLRERGYELALISSGFADYVVPVAEKLSIQHPYSFMHFLYQDGAYNGMGYSSESDELTAKVEALEHFGKKIGAAPSEIAFVGDSRNDLKAFQHGGRGILVGGKDLPDLQKAAWKTFDTLPEILGVL